MARKARRITALAAGAALLAATASCSSGSAGAGAPVPTATLKSATASPSPSPSPGLNVAAENAKPGAPDSAWDNITTGPQSAIQGYTSVVDVLPGQSFQLYVSTTAPSFTATAFRIGYYGGADARQLWQSASTPGQDQTSVTTDPKTHTVECNWSPSLTVPTTGWPEGDYLILLKADNGSGERYVPMTVRSASTTGKIVLVEGISTWEAYNTWGGYSLYQGPDGSVNDRAYAVSFDRPYIDPDEADGSALFFPFDQGEISFAEQNNLPIAYETDLELEDDPQVFDGARAIVSDGHDEYYSQQMRDTLTSAVSSGTNLAFLGANAIYRHIRWAATQLGDDRLIICYKNAEIDPDYGSDPQDTTQNWRDDPDPRPENAITGSLYQCNPVSAAYVVYDANSWIFAGTGVTQGTSFPGLVGPEYDRVVDIATTPHPIDVLSQSPLTCQGNSSYQNSSYYTTSSGAGVFDAATMRWECALGPECSSYDTAADRAFVRTSTLNLFTAFENGPAGKVHPAADNTAALGVPQGEGLGID